MLARILLAAALLCLALLPEAARAASPTSEEPESATVVLVGDVDGMTALADTLVELLRRQNVNLKVVRALQFQAGQVISGSDGDESVWAFVVPAVPSSARLYFRGPRAKRFLLRALALRNGLDDYGRELIAQVVESSVLALLRSAAGITREQASAAIDPPTESPRVATSAPAAPPMPAPARRPSDWRGWAALRYGVEWSGSDLGAAQGPGVETGLEWGRLRARLMAERWFPQTLSSPELAASLQTTAVRLVVDTSWPKRGTHALIVGFGAGMDILATQPTIARDPAVTLAPERSHAVPILRAELAYQLRADPWRLMALAFVDAALLRTHYDLDSADSQVRLATSWPARPGLALVLGWSPSIGGP